MFIIGFNQGILFGIQKGNSKMIIDFHVHIFPDAIAQRAITILAERSALQPQTDGTATDTIEKLNLWGIEKAVCLNIATKPTQQRKINVFMTETDEKHGGRLIPFGTVHPLSPTFYEEIKFIKDSNIKGIKLHPDYQNFFVNEKRYFELYSTIAQFGLPLIFHAGYDIGLGCPIHCTPLMIRKVAKEFPHLTIIAAHFGGYGMWNDASELLCDLENVLFDTAFPVGMDKETAEKLISKKGAENVLFASDCPWESPKKVANLIDSLSISSKEKDLIFSGNAKRILKI
jgi:predicted TIM-barrel fold metal-dependent hydrolase